MAGTYISLPPSSGSSAFWGDAVANLAALPATGTIGEVRLTIDTRILYEWNGAAWVALSVATPVAGPASSTDNAIARFDGTTGQVIQNSAVTIADTSGNMAGVGTISSAEITSSSLTASRALVSGASKEIQSSSVTATEIGYVSGVTSAIQTQLGTKITGPGSSTDTAIVRYSGTGGVTALNSGVLIDGSNNVTGAATVQTPIVQGGTAGSGTLTLKSTTNATKGKIIFGSASAYDEVNDRLGLGTTSPGKRLDVQGGLTRLSTTTSPVASVYDLSVQNLGSSSVWLEMINSGGAGSAGSFFGLSGNWFQIWNFQGGDISFFAGTSGGSSPERMRIAGNGNVGIGASPTASTALGVTSTTGALLVPRMTTTQKNALTGINGMIVYDTTLDLFYGYTAGAWAALQGWGS